MVKIVRINVENFKSFESIDVNLNDFNLIIGANAGGKSNFIQILKFYHDAVDYGLEDAISLQGGTQYLRNSNLKDNYKSHFRFEFKFIEKVTRRVNQGKNIININSLTNEFILDYNKRGDGFSILSERIIINVEEVNGDKNNNSTYRKDNEITITLEKRKNKKNIKVEVVAGENIDYDIKAILPPIDLIETLLEKDVLMIKYVVMFMGLRGILSDGFAIFDFDPKILKKSALVSAKHNLEDDGINLSVCLNNVLKKSKGKKIFLDQLQDMLPFVDSIITEKTLDKTMLFKIKEKYNELNYFPASLMSDGTVNIVAMILALYFDNRSLAVFEEPERNIHPALLSNLMNKFYEVSSEKQIIITTHNPQIIKHAKNEDVICIKRNHLGFTEGKRVQDIKELESFLDEEIGIDELYVDDILGGLF